MKKSYLYLIIIGAILGVSFIPSVRDFVKNQLMPMDKIEESITLDDKDLAIDLKGINVSSTNLQTLKDKKLIFLNFWGTWCPPCVEEWGSIEQLYKEKNKDVEFVLIAMLDEEDKVREFIKKNNYTAPVYIAESPLSERILPKVFPTTYLLDKGGRIIKKETSSKDWNSDEIKNLINTISNSN